MLLATGVALLAAVTAWLVIRHNVTRASLSHSVATGFGGIASCARQRTGGWRCYVLSEEESDGWGPYRVVTHGNCWHGHLTTSAAATGPRTISGCIGIWDQIRAGDRPGLNLQPRPPGFY